MVGIDQPYRLPLPSKLSNGQVDEGLFQIKLILKAKNPSSWHLRVSNAQCSSSRSVNKGSPLNFEIFTKKVDVQILGMFYS